MNKIWSFSSLSCSIKWKGYTKNKSNDMIYPMREIIHHFFVLISRPVFHAVQGPGESAVVVLRLEVHNHICSFLVLHQVAEPFVLKLLHDLLYLFPLLFLFLILREKKPRSPDPGGPKLLLQISMRLHELHMDSFVVASTFLHLFL